MILELEPREQQAVIKSLAERLAKFEWGYEHLEEENRRLKGELDRLKGECGK